MPVKQVNGEGRVFYGRLPRREDESVPGQRTDGGTLVAHVNLAVSGPRVAIVWKEFDGKKSLQRGDVLYAFWRTEREGMRLFRLQ